MRQGRRGVILSVGEVMERSQKSRINKDAGPRQADTLRIVCPFGFFSMVRAVSRLVEPDNNQSNPV